MFARRRSDTVWYVAQKIGNSWHARQGPFKRYQQALDRLTRFLGHALTDRDWLDYTIMDDRRMLAWEERARLSVGPGGQ
jgi:hypothetical protein